MSLILALTAIIPSIRPRTTTTARSRVGEITIRPTGTPKAWELEADGSSLLVADYPELFAEIGYTYGGSGLSFNLPDYRGRVPRGWAHGQSTDPDRASRTDRGDGTTGDYVGTKQSYAVEAHTHTYNTPSGTQSFQINAGGALDDNAMTSTASGAVSGATTSANETRMININVMYCIIFED